MRHTHTHTHTQYSLSHTVLTIMYIAPAGFIGRKPGTRLNVSYAYSAFSFAIRKAGENRRKMST